MIHSPPAATQPAYDPFDRGQYPVGERTLQATDSARNRVFPCEVWYPEAAGDGPWPLVVFSHHSGGHRRAATYLTTHLASHGYVVGALDHSEVVEPELARKEGETEEQKAARADAWIASRVPDMRFLLDSLLGGSVPNVAVDADRIGIVGHSFGGWTALAAPDVEPRIGSVVALAPGGSSKRRPGIIPVTLSFQWTREVPALYLVADLDAALPLDGMFEIFERAPAPKRMVVLRRADHMHFLDDAEKWHETFRTMPVTGDVAKMQADMRPIGELLSGEQAHLFIRGLTLAHFDATLRGQEHAKEFLEGDIEAALAAQGVEAAVHA